MRKISTVAFTIFVFLSIFSFIIFSSGAQNQLTHEKKVYQGENQKLYWNKFLPVYINLSPSPSGSSEVYQLKSDTSAKYAEPYYFDTEGANFIRTRWAVNKETHKTIEPKTEVLWEVYADGIAPVSTIKLNGDIVSSKGGKFSGNGLSCEISAKDYMSGLDKIYISVNGGEYKEYTSSMSFSDEGEYAILYYAVDKVGNVEEPQKESFFIDSSAPKTEFAISGDFNENTLSGNARITLKSTDEKAGASRIVYSLDSGQEKRYSVPLSAASLSEGEHTLKFYSLDKVNNKETEQVFTFYVDKSAPMINADIMGDRYSANGKEYLSGRAQVRLIAVDNKAGVQGIFYSINGGKYQPYEDAFYLTAKGSTKIDYYAVDKVGNKSSMQLKNNVKGITSYVDLTGPELDYGFIGARFKTRDTIFISSSTKIQLKGSDSESGMQNITYGIDSKDEFTDKEPFTVYTEPFTIKEEGLHKLDFYGFDNVLNSNKKTIYFIVDNSGPHIYTTFDGESITNKTMEGNTFEVYPNHVALFLSVTDKQLGYDKIYYSVNDGPETLYTNPIHGFGKGKEYKIKVKALDKLGNISYENVIFAVAE